ncbi:MAG: hypothetical protein AB7P44_08270 [Steroidobacteraceae bacterium]
MLKAFSWLTTVAAITGVMVGSAAFTQTTEADPAVKKSRRGICHERGTISYVQTIYFEPFESMKACLATGGRLSGAAPEKPVAESTNSEPRSAKGSWYGLETGYVLAASVCAFLLVGGFVWRIWYRGKARRQLRAFEQRQERAWQSHRLEPKKPLRPVK